MPKPSKVEIGLIVIEAIQAVEDNGNHAVHVSLGTSLGLQGLNHTAIQRKMYHPAIKSRMVDGWKLKSLSPNKYVSNTILDVEDVLNLVYSDLVPIPTSPTAGGQA